MNVLKIVGYVKCTETHRLLLDGIISCCVNSDKICEICVSNGLIKKLKYCIEQKGNQAVQIQGGKGLTRIVSKRQFIDGFYTQNQMIISFLIFLLYNNKYLSRIINLLSYFIFFSFFAMGFF